MNLSVTKRTMSETTAITSIAITVPPIVSAFLSKVRMLKKLKTANPTETSLCRLNHFIEFRSVSFYNEGDK